MHTEDRCMQVHRHCQECACAHRRQVHAGPSSLLGVCIIIVRSVHAHTEDGGACRSIVIVTSLLANRRQVHGTRAWSMCDRRSQVYDDDVMVQRYM
jgi:hypothetical protein